MLAKLEQAPADGVAEATDEAKVISLPSREESSEAPPARKRSSLVWMPVVLAAAACLTVGLWLGVSHLMTGGEPRHETMVASRDAAESKAAPAASPSVPPAGATAPGDATLRSREEREKTGELAFADDGIVDDFGAPEEVAEPVEESIAGLKTDGNQRIFPAEEQSRWGDTPKGASGRGAGLLSDGSAGSGSTASGTLGGLRGGDVGGGAATGKGADNSYYADWEQTKSEGEAVADESAPAPDADKSPRAPAVISETTPAAEPAYSQDEGAASGREAERLSKEDEAFRRLYGDDADGLTDMDMEDDWSAGLPSAGEAPARYERSEDALEEEAEEDEDSFAGELAAVETVELTRSRSVGKKAGSGAGRPAAKDRSRGNRSDIPDRDSRRSSKSKKAGAAQAPNLQSERGPSEEDAAEYKQAQESQAPAEAEPASNAASDPADGAAEWSLQTTNAGAPYQVATLCADVGIPCRWVSPANKAQSLDALANYQIVELRVVVEDYEAFKARIRPLGNLLVRTEDVAMLDDGGPVVIRLVIEYLP